MIKIHSVLVVLFFVQLLTAQNTIGLQIPGNQTVLFGDSINSWSSKLLWYPNQAAFRAGYAGSPVWDEVNTGLYSFASGVGTEASHTATTALGWFSKATGEYSTAMGVSGTASGSHAVAIGTGTLATSAYSTAMGIYNASYGNMQDWVSTDPILQIGIGTSTANRKNALTILKNGQAHIPHGLDASLNTNGFLMLGNPSGYNVIIDDNEIMARNNGQTAPIYINLEGGYTYLGGSIYMPGVFVRNRFEYENRHQFQDCPLG